MARPCATPCPRWNSAPLPLLLLGATREGQHLRLSRHNILQPPPLLRINIRRKVRIALSHLHNRVTPYIDPNSALWELVIVKERNG